MDIIQNLTAIFVTFSIGVFFGSLWMFFAMYKSNKRRGDELDVKNRELERTQIKLRGYIEEYDCE